MPTPKQKKSPSGTVVSATTVDTTPKLIRDKDTIVLKKEPFNAHGVVDGVKVPGDEVIELNRKRLNVEPVAKNDSIKAAKISKEKGSNIYVQRREGNKAANATRKKAKLGDFSVTRFNNPHQYSAAENHTGQKDTYIRLNKLENDVKPNKKKKP